MKTPILVMVILTTISIHMVSSYPTQKSRGAKRNFVYEAADNVVEGSFDTRQHKQLSTGSSDITSVITNPGISAKQPTAYLPGNGFSSSPLKSPFTQDTRQAGPTNANPGSSLGNLGSPPSGPGGNRGTGNNQSPSNKGTGNNNKKKSPGSKGKDKEEVSSEEGSNEEDDDSSQEDSQEPSNELGRPPNQRPPPKRVEPEDSIEEKSNEEEEEEEEDEE